MHNPTKGRLTGIEAGRGVAAVIVVSYHAARHLNKVYGVPALMSAFQFGHAGVDFFFVISGFIILFVHYDDIGAPARLGHYLKRRLTRVMPIYWVALALTVILSLAGGRHGFPSPLTLIWSIFLLPSHTEPLLGIAWTLQFEIVFYIVFSILIFNRMAGVVVLSFWLVWIVWAAAGNNDTELPQSLYGVYNLEFFLGMTVAFLCKNYRVLAPRCILVFGLVLFLSASLAEDGHFFNGYSNLARIAYSIPSALIILGATETECRELIIIPAALRTLGAASYSIYLFQFVFIGVLWKLWLAAGLDARMPHVASFGLLAGGGVIGGILMSRLVEYPLMRLMRGGRLKAAPHAALG